MNDVAVVGDTADSMDWLNSRPGRQRCPNDSGYVTYRSPRGALHSPENEQAQPMRKRAKETAMNSRRRFDGRIAVITGAAGGLGRAYAHLLAAEGASVVVNDLPSAAGPLSAEAVADEIIAAGGSAVADCHDVTTNAAKIIDTAVRTWGKIDLLVNNAGATDGGQIDEMPEAQLDRLIDVNLRGTVAVTRAAWPILRRQRFGRIVNTASGSVLGLQGCYAYQTTKASIIGLTRALALDGAQHGIKVNAVNPIAYTRMTAQIPDPAFRQFLVEYFQPEQAAAFVGALLSDEVPCSGELFSVGGGIAARVVLAFNAGYVAGRNATIDDYLSNFATIRNMDNLTVPAHAADEISLRARQVGAGQQYGTSDANAPDWSSPSTIRSPLS